MPAQKKNTKRYVKTPKTVQKKDADNKKDSKQSFSHQLVPYVFAVVSVFLLFCLVSNLFCNPSNSLAGGNEGDHTLGVIGFWVCQILFGIFGPAAFAIPVILLCFVIFWKNYNKRDFVSINAIIAAVTEVTIAAFIHAVTYAGQGKEAFAFDLADFFENGAKLVGGGFLGGVLSTALVLCLNVGGAIFVMIALLIPFITFLAGTTPIAVAGWIMAKIKAAMAEQRELAKERREEAAEEKKAADKLAAEKAAAIAAEKEAQLQQFYKNVARQTELLEKLAEK